MTSVSIPALRKGGSVADLRESNLSLVLQALSSGGALSRAEIAKQCGLGVTALTSLVNELLLRRLVVESTELVRPTIGRPTSLLEMDTGHWAVLGILCDRRTLAVATGGLDGAVTDIARFPVARDGEGGFETYRPFLAQALTAALLRCRANGRVLAAVEVAVPGAVNRESGDVVRSVLNGWSRVALRDEIQGILATVPRDVAAHGPGTGHVLVGVDRETNYSMLTHVYRGATARNLAYIGGRNALSGGLYSRSSIEHGASGLAGEFGHLVVDPEGARCWCGRQGCVETRLGLAHLYSVCTGLPEAESFHLLADSHKTMLNDILAGVAGGNPRHLQTLADAGRWLGIAIDTIAAVVNPDEIVVDGYLARLRPYLEPGTRSQLETLGPLPSLSKLRITYGVGAEDGSLQGAVLAARDTVIRRPAVASAIERRPGQDR
ncbi:ROK family protein [Arthrobacter sp. SDTb3-6]|uniref:ROK family protein n=1 Tax=Arthrobacter sp. SDTb3-6 TaxID=2713571 RepID=UPI00159E7DD0|nr:ROK family protein [Arthrobacter sp. SDTb3-6]